MNLIRLIAIIIVVWLVIRMVRGWLERQQRPDQPGREQRHTLPAGDMVKCDFCGLHIPRDESQSESNRFYCSTEHKRRALEKEKN